MLNGKVVLITGGTGSFGNKFVETILRGSFLLSLFAGKQKII